MSIDWRAAWVALLLAPAVAGCGSYSSPSTTPSSPDSNGGGGSDTTSKSPPPGYSQQ